MSEVKNQKDEIIKISQKSLLSFIFFQKLRWTLIPLSLILIALILWSFISADFRFAILGLMIIFIIIPLIMAFAYFFYALHPDIAFNTLPHSLNLIKDEELLIKIYPRNKKTELKFGKSSIETEVINEQPEEIIIKLIPLNSLEKLYIGMSDYILYFNSQGLLFIPENYLNSHPDFKDNLLSFLKNNISYS